MEYCSRFKLGSEIRNTLFSEFSITIKKSKISALKLPYTFLLWKLSRTLVMGRNLKRQSGQLGFYNVFDVSNYW